MIFTYLNDFFGFSTSGKRSKYTGVQGSFREKTSGGERVKRREEKKSQNKKLTVSLRHLTNERTCVFSKRYTDKKKGKKENLCGTQLYIV